MLIALRNAGPRQQGLCSCPEPAIAACNPSIALLDDTLPPRSSAQRANVRGYLHGQNAFPCCDCAPANVFLARSKLGAAVYILWSRLPGCGGRRKTKGAFCARLHASANSVRGIFIRCTTEYSRNQQHHSRIRNVAWSLCFCGSPACQERLKQRTCGWDELFTVDIA